MKKWLWLFLFAFPLAAQVSQPNPQSRVAGRFVAFNYGQWNVGLYQPPAGTGSQTFSVSTATVQLPDGRQVMPFATNAPLYVGTEKVTVSAVGSGCVLNTVQPGACVLTATFANPHTNAERVSSATFGLQEALDDAGASGGGAATIDSAWENSGGTTAIKNAATLPSNTAIEDVRTGTGGGGGGGVTQLIAGTNITLDPSGGTGVVTINATGGGGIGGTVSSPNVPYASGADTLSDSGFQYYLGGSDPLGDCASDSQPCLVATQSGEGTASIGPNRISIVNAEDDATQSVMNDGSLILTNIGTTATATYGIGLIQFTDPSGSGSTFGPNSMSLVDSSNNDLSGNAIGLAFNSGTTPAYADIAYTGLTIGGSTSGSAAIGVAAVAGTPNGILLPTTTASPGGLLTSDGGNPQQTSWTTTPILTAVSTGTASNTDLAGVITASTGTASYTFSGTYVSAPVCIVQDDTTIASLLTKTVTSTTLTVTTTGTTDAVSYICHGRD